MSRDAERELLSELSNDKLQNYIKKNLQAEIQDYDDYVRKLYLNFNIEVEANLTMLNNFPKAYTYIKESQFEFLSLQGNLVTNIAHDKNLSCYFENQTTDSKSQTHQKIIIQNSFNTKSCNYLLLKADLLKELRDDFFQGSNNYCPKRTIKWFKSHTDLIEFVEMLINTGIIGHKGRKLTLTEAVNDMASMFGFQIKDIHSKLARARSRKVATDPKVYKILANFMNAKNAMPDN